MRFVKDHSFAIFLAIILFLIPFFWMKPGEMDLGGDSSRLYFYEPLSYFIHDGLFYIDNVIEGIKTIEPHFYNLPYVLFIIFLKYLLDFLSIGYSLTSIMTGIKLSLSFFSVYLIISTIITLSYREKKKHLIHLASILGGILYISAPIMTGNYDKAIVSHNQVFLNPLMFYLLLRYFLSKQTRYFFLVIVISSIFAPNFAWSAAPPFFAFYPLALSFLIIYIIFVEKISIKWKHVSLWLFFLIGIHSFHLIPEIYSLFNSGSYVNTRVFNTDNILQQLNYFYGVLPHAKLSFNMLLYNEDKLFKVIAIIAPVIVVLGFIINRNRAFLVNGIFFLLSLYLVTANITESGVELYESFFYIPGFSMFRNFIGQWAFVYSFFYAILFGQAVYLIYKKFLIKYTVALFFVIVVSLILYSWKFINGEIVNKTHFQSDDIKIAHIIDPSYEDTLSFIKTLKGDGSIISFPFTDCCYSVIYGRDGGAYVGLSPVSLLTGKKDINGYIAIAPFGETFLQLVKNKDYKSIEKLFTIMNIDYIYYNSDPKIYDDSFSGYPYNTMRQYFPQTQKDYSEFIKPLLGEKLFEKGPYAVYSVHGLNQANNIFIPKEIEIYKNDTKDWYGLTTSFFINTNSLTHIEQNSCKTIFHNKCKENIFYSVVPNIKYEKINPTKYKVYISDASSAYFLTLQETFHKNWNVFYAEESTDTASLTTKGLGIFETFFMKQIASNSHIMVNSYANGWYINSDAVENKKKYILIIEMVEQRLFHIGLVITILTFLSILMYYKYMYNRKYNTK